MCQKYHASHAHGKGHPGKAMRGLHDVVGAIREELAQPSGTWVHYYY